MSRMVAIRTGTRGAVTSVTKSRFGRDSGLVSLCGFSLPALGNRGRLSIEPAAIGRMSDQIHFHGRIWIAYGDIQMAVGFRVFTGGAKVDADVVNRFRNLPVANVSDAMNRMSAGAAMLRPMHAGSVLAGAAVTVKTRPGDNLMMHKAFDIAEPGDVIVVDAGGDVTNAIIGENAAAYA